ncbi:hypothetical protein FNJ88_07500 [Chryseobacterium sp. SNU WT5]|uniref:hypothetical protein n=1 Tax=Chryseobacterium sp. SNU WT5 TaxID=2594269 RepID=UPI00117C6F7D|nr:hypothetical protein [Chryseobacterium sp. SNU WT5]QDP85412.1 hypothetical protein FNJ88_07500 [Chryseobacterium sp. SNU WT5]
MITEKQKAEIQNYLFAKKLPVDILMEVHDHFVSQITDLKTAEGLTFEQAFSKTKDSWKEELTTFYPFYILRKIENVLITRFEQKIRKREITTRILQSLALTFFIFILGVITSQLNKDVILTFIKYAFLGINLFCYGTILYNLIINNFIYKKEFSVLKFSTYHWRSYFALPFSILGSHFLKPITSWTSEINAEFYYKISVLFLLVLCLIYTGISQIKLAKTLRIIKPNLTLNRKSIVR